MPTVVGQIDTVSELFNGQGDIIVFDKPADLSSATLKTLANPKSLGDIKLDSTSWSGDDPTVNLIKNEQGETVITTVEAGTFGFEFTAMSTSPAMLTKLFGASAVSASFTTNTDLFATGSVVTGFGTTPTIVECPIMVVNSTLNKSIIFPNAEIVSNLTIEDKVYCIKCKVTAKNINTANLKTVMVISGDVDYSA